MVALFAFTHRDGRSQNTSASDSKPSRTLRHPMRFTGRLWILVGRQQRHASFPVALKRAKLQVRECAGNGRCTPAHIGWKRSWSRKASVSRVPGASMCTFEA